jgi:hypothetical protein
MRSFRVALRQFTAGVTASLSNDPRACVTAFWIGSEHRFVMGSSRIVANIFYSLIFVSRVEIMIDA